MSPTTEVSRKRRHRRVGERGAVLIEAAFITPVFFMLIFGIIDFGLAFHDKLTVANVSLSAARTGTTQGNDALADYEMMRAVKAALGGMAPESVQVIVIYKATRATDKIPTACKGGVGQTGLCNVYVPADFNAATTSFGCGPTALDRFWCPTTRKIASSPETGGPPDYLGVYVRARHTNVTGFFGTGWTFTEDSVLRIEAREL